MAEELGYMAEELGYMAEELGFMAKELSYMSFSIIKDKDLLVKQGQLSILLPSLAPTPASVGLS